MFVVVEWKIKLPKRRNGRPGRFSTFRWDPDQSNQEDPKSGREEKVYLDLPAKLGVVQSGVRR